MTRPKHADKYSSELSSDRSQQLETRVPRSIYSFYTLLCLTKELLYADTNNAIMQAHVLFATAALLLATCVLGGEIKCACEVTIDCANTASMTAAVQQLNSSDCSTDCTSSTCRTNFFIVQAHHDYCLNTLPESVSEAMHDYEGECTECHIERQFDSALPTCPAYECSSTTEATTAAAALTSGSCDTDCSSTACTNAYRIVRAAHDRCEEDDMPEAIEDGIHDFEESCESAECNVATKDAGVPTCSAAHVGAGVAVPLISILVALMQ